MTTLSSCSNLLDEIDALVQETTVTVSDARTWAGTDGTFVDYKVEFASDAAWHKKHAFYPRRTFAEFQWLAEQLLHANVHVDPLPSHNASADELSGWLAAVVQNPANLV